MKTDERKESFDLRLSKAYGQAAGTLWFLHRQLTNICEEFDRNKDGERAINEMSWLLSGIERAADEVKNLIGTDFLNRSTEDTYQKDPFTLAKRQMEDELCRKEEETT